MLHVCRQRCHAQFVNLVKLFRIRQRCTRHPPQLPIKPEVVLQGNSPDRDRFLFDLNLFLGLDRFVQAVRIATPRHQTTRKVINNNDLTLLHHIMHIPLKHIFCFQRIFQIIGQVVKIGIV